MAALIMETEEVAETLVFISAMMQLIAQKDFDAYERHISVDKYFLKKLFFV
jgi:hypothetical protein